MGLATSTGAVGPLQDRVEQGHPALLGQQTGAGGGKQAKKKGGSYRRSTTTRNSMRNLQPGARGERWFQDHPGRFL